MITKVSEAIMKRWRDQSFWRLAQECKGKCAYCGLDGSKDWRILSNFAIDHLIPGRAGGTDHPSNLVLACGGCNRDKSSYDPSDGTAMTELTPDARLQMILKSQKFIEDYRVRLPYYRLLQQEIASK